MFFSPSKITNLFRIFVKLMTHLFFIISSYGSDKLESLDRNKEEKVQEENHVDIVVSIAES